MIYDKIFENRVIVIIIIIIVIVIIIIIFIKKNECHSNSIVEGLQG